MADAAVFLLSELSRAVTGEMLHVDGGYHSQGAPAAAHVLEALGGMSGEPNGRVRVVVTGMGAVEPAGPRRRVELGRLPSRPLGHRPHLALRGVRPPHPDRRAR